MDPAGLPACLGLGFEPGGHLGPVHLVTEELAPTPPSGHWRQRKWRRSCTWARRVASFSFCGRRPAAERPCRSVLDATPRPREGPRGSGHSPGRPLRPSPSSLSSAERELALVEGLGQVRIAPGPLGRGQPVLGDRGRRTRERTEPCRRPSHGRSLAWAPVSTTRGVNRAIPEAAAFSHWANRSTSTAASSPEMDEGERPRTRACKSATEEASLRCNPAKAAPAGREPANGAPAGVRVSKAGRATRAP